MDYQKFKEEFEETGLSQKKYAEQKGLSPSMVCYYLKKGRENNLELKEESFRKVEVVSSLSKSILIRTSGGLEIEIPL